MLRAPSAKSLQTAVQVSPQGRSCPAPDTRPTRRRACNFVKQFCKGKPHAPRVQVRRPRYKLQCYHTVLKLPQVLPASKRLVRGVASLITGVLVV